MLRRKKRKTEVNVKPVPPDTMLFVVQVAGTTYHPDVLQAFSRSAGYRPLPDGDLVTTKAIAWLWPEPTNPHDPNAVQVWCEHGQLGYVYRRHAPEVARHVAEFWEQHGALPAVRVGFMGGTKDKPNIGVRLLLPQSIFPGVVSFDTVISFTT